MSLYTLDEIMRAYYDRESTGDRLNSRCRYSVWSETMFDHTQGLQPNDFQSIVLTVGVRPNRCNHNSSSRTDFID